jgi:hypothetical protein
LAFADAWRHIQGEPLATALKAAKWRAAL